MASCAHIQTVMLSGACSSPLVLLVPLSPRSRSSYEVTSKISLLVQGYVDCKNNFSVTIRVRFTALSSCRVHRCRITSSSLCLICLQEQKLHAIRYQTARLKDTKCSTVYVSPDVRGITCWIEVVVSRSHLCASQ
jgi:hypothetical protein